jgi:hypothetical protein
MNTSVEFFEWLLHHDNEDNSSLAVPRDPALSPPFFEEDERRGTCRLAPAPSLASLSDSEENSSLESDDGETFASSDCCGGLVLLGDDPSCHDRAGRAPGAEDEEEDQASRESEDEEEIGAPSHEVEEEGGRRPSPPRRTVSFKNVEVREYSITVGDHPMCYDGLPLTLDWEHSPSVEIRDVSTSRERSGNYRAPRRLSFDERRERLFSAAAAAAAAAGGGAGAPPTEGGDQRSLELGLVIKMLHNSWSMNSILPPPILDDIEEVDSDFDDDSDGHEREEEPRRRRPRRRGSSRAAPPPTPPSRPPPEQVVEWKRVPFRRSNAFCE